MNPNVELTVAKFIRFKVPFAEMIPSCYFTLHGATLKVQKANTCLVSQLSTLAKLEQRVCRLDTRFLFKTSLSKKKVF